MTDKELVNKIKFIPCLFVMLVLVLSGCGNFTSTIESKNKTSLLPCTNNAVTTGPCEVDTAGKVVSDNFGSGITVWTNTLGTTSVNAPIPNGFYANQNVTFTDLNLLAANIVNGVSIFGVAGTATGPYAACTDDALNAGQCSTAASRYVTATSGNDVTSWTNGSSTTTVTGTIPNAYYSAKSCQFTDADLIATNIKTGVNIFGVPGSLTEAYAACTDDALNVAQCSTAANRYVTATNGANVNGANGSLSASIPTGFYTGRTCTMSDTNLLVGNIRNGVNIFGTVGTFAGAFDESMASSAYRNPGSIPVANHLDNQSLSDQITLKDENTTYAGDDLPTTGGLNYRDIPDQAKDDEGYLGTSCKYAPRPTIDCGTGDATLDARIADCAAANPTASTWDGAVQCNGGEGTWRLVTRDGANKEVWRDERTKLIWSSAVSTSTNWCRASGNIQLAPVTYSTSHNNAAGTPMTGNGTIGNITGGGSSLSETITITFTGPTTFTVTGTGGAGGCQGGSIVGGLTATPGTTATYSDAGFCSFTITQGTVNFANNDKFIIASTKAQNPSGMSCAPSGPLQPATPISYCAEGPGFDDGAIGETWTVPATYMAAKGRLGRNSTPSVAWRLPTINDYKSADVNGIRFVLPDMGIAGTSRPTIDASPGSSNYEWSASVYSAYRNNSWVFAGYNGGVNGNPRSNTNVARCVGR